MTEHIITLRWSFRCHRCGHEWTRDQEAEQRERGVEHAPPPVPSRCEECRGDLAGEPHAWSRTFEIEDVLALSDG